MTITDRLDITHDQVESVRLRVGQVRDALDQAEDIMARVDDVLEVADDVLEQAAAVTRSSRRWLPIVLVGTVAIAGGMTAAIIWRRRQRKEHADDE